MEGGAGGVCAVLVALGVEQVVGAGGGGLCSLVVSGSVLLLASAVLV